MLGFGGGLYDSDTGFVHFGYREYDPVIGRFISPDPLGYDGGDVDIYGFCLDDPINFVDRDGLKNRTQAADEEEKANESLEPEGDVSSSNELIDAEQGTEVEDKEEKSSETENEESNGNEQQPRYDKKAGADNSRPAPLKKKFAGADREVVKTKNKQKPKLTLKDLGSAAFEGVVKGAPIGAVYGGTLGPLGSAAGGATGAVAGASINMLYKVGGLVLSELTGINEDSQKSLREAMEKINGNTSKRPKK